MSDYIKREDARKAACELCDWNGFCGDGCIGNPIDDVPAADVVERKKGRWKGAGMGDYYCSICQRLMNPRTNFCPNCGADMREKEE